MRRQITEHLVAAILLALFVLALFFRLLFTDRVLASGDILHYFYPYRDFAAAAVRAGRIPLWNPYIFLGAPFLANPQAAVLYPLHWPLSWLPVTRQIAWSGAIHAWLLGLGGYALMRRWGCGSASGLATGLLLAGSGFYGGLLGHINQMNGAAWLPWAVWVLEAKPLVRSTPGRFRFLKSSHTWHATAGFGLLVALMLLAGHTQTVYINLFGIGVWIISPALVELARKFWRQGRKLSHVNRLGSLIADSQEGLSLAGRKLFVYVGGVLLGVLLAGAQLLPTLELSRLGLRSGGLGYGEATSFSLKPLKLLWTLLPSYGLVDLSVVFDTLGYTEFVAYVGAIGLALALLGLLFRSRQGTSPWLMGVTLAGLGLFLALGRWNPVYFVLFKLVPGFDLFRTPARWMMLYTLGMAVLAGLGTERILHSWLPSTGRWVRQPAMKRGQLSPRLVVVPALVLFLGGDLLLAARALPLSHPTAHPAVYDVRTAPAYLLTDPDRAAIHPALAGRFLSMSTITFDPGDMADWQHIYRDAASPQLDESAFREFIIALKAQEILAPNLPLLWRIPSVDGFDGGVLPLLRYNQFLTLFIPPNELVPDGRLREQLTSIPPADLLGLMNVKYVITDKVRDLWFDGIYYDRQIGAQLLQPDRPDVEIYADRPLEATTVHVIGYVDGSADALRKLESQNRPVATLAVKQQDAVLYQAALTAGGASGAQWADGKLDSPLARSSGAIVAFRDVDGARQEYLAKIALPTPTTLTSIQVTATDPALSVVIQAMTLVDERTGMFVPLLPSDRGRFRLVHSGDVKIYENLDVVPRARLTSNVRKAAGPDEALTILKTAEHIGDLAVVEGGLDFQASEMVGRQDESLAESADVVVYGPERVEIQIHAERRRLLVLADSFYPGWQATVDGIPTQIFPTNILFRGVIVPAGDHRVVFRYDPPSWRAGLGLSGVGLALWMVLLIVAWFQPGTFRPTENSGV